MRTADAVRRLVEKWGKHPYDINNGDCEAFAHELVKMIGRGEAMEDNLQGHWFVKDGPRYYDAESPEGDTNWQYLPIFRKRHAKLVVTLDNEGYVVDCPNEVTVIRE